MAGKQVNLRADSVLSGALEGRRLLLRHAYGRDGGDGRDREGVGTTARRIIERFLRLRDERLREVDLGADELDLLVAAFAPGPLDERTVFDLERELHSRVEAHIAELKYES